MIQSDYLQAYYKQHDLAMKGVPYRAFVKQCSAYSMESPQMDHYYVMQQVASALLKKTGDVAVPLTIKEAVTSKAGGPVRLRGYVKKVSESKQNAWGKSYCFVTLSDNSGQIDAILSGEMTNLSQFNIQQGDSVEICGQIKEDRKRFARLNGITSIKKIAPVSDYVRTLSVSELVERSYADIHVKVLKIVADTSPRPNTAIVEDPKGIAVLKYWPDTLKLAEGGFYEITQVYAEPGPSKRILVSSKTVAKVSKTEFYTYLSDVYLTSLEGVTPGLVYNIEATLTMVVEFKYTSRGSEQTAMRYVFTTADDEAELTLVDWRHQLTTRGIFAKGTNHRYRLRYVCITAYNSKWNLLFEKFSEVSDN